MMRAPLLRKPQPSPPPVRTLQRKCPKCGGSKTPSGDCSACAQQPLRLQRRLAIGASNDPLERQADRVADQVLARRRAPSGTSWPVTLHRHAPGADGGGMEAPPRVHRVLGQPGRALDGPVRREMEAGFGRDFSQVRVHDGAEAGQSARDVDASAYTVGSNIAFAPGRYAPSSRAGQQLIAHELAHVVQQGASPESLRRAPDPPDAGPAPTPKSEEEVGSAKLAKELKALIADAEWKQIRKRAYPRESAAGIKLAKDRRAGKAPDLTGLGSIKSLDKFAVLIRALQKKWSAISSPDNRVKEIDTLLQGPLKEANVPKFIQVSKFKTEFKGAFASSIWSFFISEALVTNNSLSNADAGELANTSLHECRHAEQNFLAARYAAGVKGEDAATIASTHDIPPTIAAEAVAAKFDSGTDATTKKLGETMHQATVTDKAANQKISDDDGLKEMAALRVEAQAALSALLANETPATLSSATAKRDALKAQVAEVERLYTLYRNIPYEKDAHEVGDAAEEAFKLSK